MQDNHLFDEQEYFKKMHGPITWWHNLDMCLKYVKFSSVTNLVHPVTEEELGLMLPYDLKKIQKSVSQDVNSRLHMSTLC